VVVKERGKRCVWKKKEKVAGGLVVAALLFVSMRARARAPANQRDKGALRVCVQCVCNPAGGVF